jgi:hypothetical protein
MLNAGATWTQEAELYEIVNRLGPCDTSTSFDEVGIFATHTFKLRLRNQAQLCKYCSYIIPY